MWNMVVVHCNHGSGVVLRLHETVDGPLGTKEIRQDAKASPVELRTGRNEIDDGFWQAWSEQNKDSSLITGKIIEQEKDAQEKKDT